MPKLTWDKIGERRYETGVNKGVLYIPNGAGVYDTGVAWNGLTTVTESPSGAEPTPIYADNIKYLNLVSAEEFTCSVEAYTCPPEFYQFDGLATPAPGVYVGQQTRRSFGFSYQTRVGNDLEAADFGRKIHLVYGATAAPSERSNTTINDTPEAMTLSWEFSTTPVDAGDNLKPTAHLVVDSTAVDAADLAALEDILYGTTGTSPRLPLPAEVLALFGGVVTEVKAATPTFNSETDVITIPAVTGVIYSVNGEDVAAGPFGPIEVDTFVLARAAEGYKLSLTSDNDWVFEPA